MKISRNSLRFLSLAVSSLAASASAEILVGWETTGQTAWGIQALPATSPSFRDPDLAVGGLTRGAGLATTNSAVANAWGGHGMEGPLTAADAILAENFITFSVTPSATFELSAASLDLSYRRSSSGPTDIAIQYQIGGGAFTDVGTFSLSSTSSGGATITGIDLSTIPALQDLAAATVTFRLVPFGATDASGVFYIYGPIPGFDLKLNGTVQTIGSTGDPEPPLIAALSPNDNSNTITVDGAEKLTIVFNENIALGSGLILIKNFTTGATVSSIDVTNFDQVSLIDNELSLLLATPLTAGASYYVEIPATAIKDQATPANAFAGFSGTPNDAAATPWNFTVATAGAPPSVVVNKYLNSTTDRIELLVTGSEIAGSKVDLRGMILKDFSGSMANDGGGRFTFSDAPLWASVPVGTLIVVSNAATSPDVSSTDYKVSVGLTDTTYFSVATGSGTFDIATTEMVMIKAAGSDPAGTAGGIHALAGGTAGAQYTGFSGAKLRATGTSGTNAGVVANNATSTLTDYNGTGATGGLPLTLASFGVPNNGTNAAYIAALRGLVPGDGDGVASIQNSTVGSPFIGRGLFDDGQTGQSIKVIINAQIPGVTLTNVSITVPASLGTPSTAVASGAGAGTPVVNVTGQTVSISATAATTANALEVTINGLSTPVPTLASDNGNYPLTVSTSASGGTLTPIASQPPVRVIIPIASLRDVDANGVALDTGSVVAIEGVATEADFGDGVANFSGFVQDATAGINLFSPTINPGLVRGTRYAVLGSIIQFNGLTEISPAAAEDIIGLGATTEPVPVVVTLANLLANAEAYEGRLVTVQNLTYVSGTWGVASNVLLKDSVPTNIDIRIQAGSTAVSAPTYPVNVTGIFGQRDTASPFTTGYQLMPRDPADLTPGTLSDFDVWAAAAGATGGMTGDPDRDGQDNASEYAFGLNPSSGSSLNPIAVPLNKATGKFSYTRRTQSLTGLTYKVFTSTTLATWVQDTGATVNVSGPVADVETVEITLSAAAPLAAPRLFIRVVAE
jgi:hypothetical protein